MKIITSFLVIFLLISCRKTTKQEKSTQETELADVPKTNLETEHETFSYKEGDTTYVMQKYFMVFLKKGPNREQDSITSADIQKAHNTYLEKLHLDGKICIAGPFEDESAVSGIVIFNTPTFKETDSLMQQDPAVKAGRLVVEVHPWWAAKGSVLK